MRLLFTCAGTAGHINPAIAVAGYFKKIMPDTEMLFIGSGREMENRLIPMAGFKIINIKSKGFQRGFSPGEILWNIRAAADLFIGTSQAKRTIRRFKPDAVIGTGGYVCYPVLTTAAKMGIPTFIHESNAMPGLTTRMVSDKVSRVMVAFPDMEKNYKCPEKVVFTGTPVRSEFMDMSKEEAKAKLGLAGKKLVVSFWGSLGADIMNGIMADFIEINSERGGFHHIHATGGGEEGLEKMRAELSRRGVTPRQLSNTDLRMYIDNMPTVMTAADIVLCRSGASTIGELTAIGKPSVLVPSPYVVDNHQEKNARSVEDIGGAVMIKEAECTGRLLYDRVSEILKDEKRLESMSRAVKRMGVPDSAERIAREILNFSRT